MDRFVFKYFCRTRDRWIDQSMVSEGNKEIIKATKKKKGDRQKRGGKDERAAPLVVVKYKRKKQNGH